MVRESSSGGGGGGGGGGGSGGGDMVMKPAWLDGLMAETFFAGCGVHENRRKNEKNVFCLECCQSICPHCLPSHRSHPLLQVSLNLNFCFFKFSFNAFFSFIFPGNFLRGRCLFLSGTFSHIIKTCTNFSKIYPFPHLQENIH